MIYVAAAIVVATLVAMTTGKVHPVVALLVALITAGLLGIAPAEDLFSGLSNPGVLTVAAMLVIAKGILHTGVVSRVMARLLSGASSAQQVLRRLMAPLGIASSLINTTPLVALLIPATRELEQNRGIPTRQVLLPIAHITTLAGTVTLIGTSTNLLIAGIAGKAGVGLSMLSFASVALPVALMGWLTIYLIAPRLLRGGAPAETTDRDWRVEIPVMSPALAEHHRAAHLGIARTQQYELTSIRRWGETVPADTRIEADDVLVFAATETGVTALWGSPLFGMSPHKLFTVSVRAGESGTLSDLEHTGSLRVIAARTTKPLRDSPLVPGDTCYVSGESPDAVARSDAVALWQDAASRVPQPRKTGTALAILLAVIVAASFGLAPVQLVAGGGALLMVLLGVITPRAAARALDWKLLFLLAGSIGLGVIVVESGIADVISTAIGKATGGSLALGVVIMALATVTMTNLVTNAATASILAPVGLTVAAELGADPVTILALIGTCISFTFLNPFGHQSNMMVMRPGGYTTATFARFGAPLLITCFVAACAVAYLLLRT